MIPESAKQDTLEVAKKAVQSGNDMLLELLFSSIWLLGHGNAREGKTEADCPWMVLPDSVIESFLEERGL